MTDTTDPMQRAVESLLIMPETAPELEPEQDQLESEAVEDETAVEETEAAEAETSDEEATEDDEETKAPEAITVKVDGKEVAVTLEDLKRSYSGQAYIQKGMQEAADARKQSAAMFEALQAEQAKFVEIVQQVQSQGIKAAPKAPDAALAKSDPIGYLQADAEYRQQFAEYQDQQQKLQYVTRQQAALQEAALAEHVAEQKRVLFERIPEFADPKRGAEIQEKIRKIGGEVYGFTDQELGGVTDARHVQVLYDAMQWRALQSGKVQPKKAEPPKVLKPQAKLAQPPQLARAKQLEAAKKSGDLRSFASAALLVRK